MGTGRRVWEAFGGALCFGVLVGLALGWNAGAYLAGGAIATLAAVVGGSQHDDLRSALLRGVCGGTTFGSSVLLGYALGGASGPTIGLPDPHVLFLLTTIVPAFPLHAAGWALGRRVRARIPATAEAAL
jgi:hypothetical protein